MNETGPKTSSRPQLISSVTWSKMVGPTKKPFSKPGSDEVAAVEEQLGALGDAFSIHLDRSLVPALTTGPSSVLGS